MLTIQNYKKILGKHFGEWMSVEINENPTNYQIEYLSRRTDRSITIVVFRDDIKSAGDSHVNYFPIKVVDNDKVISNSSIIEDYIQKENLEDLEIFGEVCKHYCNSLPDNPF